MSEFATGLSIHKTPSAGSVIKRICEINPALSVQELSAIIHRATLVRGAEAAEYANVAVIDEALALQLARDTLTS